MMTRNRLIRAAGARSDRKIAVFGRSVSPPSSSFSCTTLAFSLRDAEDHDSTGSPFSFQVKVEGRTQFLSAVCMSCLEGSDGQPVRCRFCTAPWDGSSLVLGTMYSYDIFAAMPCCSERLKVSPEFVIWSISTSPRAL